MISSAPRSNVAVELVTNASITLWSSPELASLITSETGPPGRRCGGKGFSLLILLAGASSISITLFVVSVSTGPTAGSAGSDSGCRADWAAGARGALTESGSNAQPASGTNVIKTPALNFHQF